VVTQQLSKCISDNGATPNFFKDLLERAVKEDRLGKTSYVHFLLRTESFTDPDFFKNLEKRMAEVRKEYDLPDYLWNPF
jgi:hypothetical protein